MDPATAQRAGGGGAGGRASRAAAASVAVTGTPFNIRCLTQPRSVSSNAGAGNGLVERRKSSNVWSEVVA